MKKTIVMVGVGGQGLLLASSIIGNALVEKDINVTISEVHGMAQRGGEVTTTLVIGDSKGSLAGTGGADAILGFEPAETYKAMCKASNETIVIMNKNPIIPSTVSMGLSEYPAIEDIEEAIASATEKLVSLDALKIAKEAGAAIAANIVMLGALAGTEVLPLTKEEIEATMKKRVPPAYLEANLKAFNAGYALTNK